MMKKILLILICLFLSFEVKSKYLGHVDDPEDCIKYLEKGRILHKREERLDKKTDDVIVETFFVYKKKTYMHILVSDRDTLRLKGSYCKVLEY